MDTAVKSDNPILINQAALLQQLLMLWEQAMHGDFPVSVFVIDVDRFSRLENKSICFEEILDAVHGLFHRKSDFITRFNRKQIIAISSHMDFRQCSQLADRIHRAVAALEIFHPYSPTGRYATVSIGHASYTPMAHDNSYGVLDLLATVFKHVRTAKYQGGNRSQTRLHSRVLTQAE